MADTYIWQWGFVDLGSGAAWAAVAMTAAALLLKTRQIKARRTILEHGLLNIASSAVLWHVVVKAHLIATELSEREEEPDYMRFLSLTALSAAKDPYRVWECVALQTLSDKWRVLESYTVPRY